MNSSTQHPRLVVACSNEAKLHHSAAVLREQGLTVHVHGPVITAAGTAQGAARALHVELSEVSTVGVVARRFINQMTGKPFDTQPISDSARIPFARLSQAS